MTPTPQQDGSGDVIWTARGLHHHIEVVSSPAQATRPSTARQYIAVDALVSSEFVREAFFPLGPNDSSLVPLARTNMRNAIDVLTETRS